MLTRTARILAPLRRHLFPMFSRPASDDVCLVHIHLPRTGGTSLRQTLIPLLLRRLTPDRIFLVDHGPEHGCRCGSLSDLERFVANRPGVLRFISGHIPVETAGLVANAFTFTVLRAPLERALSDYWYCFHARENPAHAAARRLSPLGFCTGQHGQSCNGQARYLSGVAFDGGTLSDAQMLGRSKAALDTIDGVGVFEHLPEMLDALCAIAGVPPVGALERLNAAERLTSVSAHDRSRIAEINRLDEILYAAARCRWAQRDGWSSNETRSPGLGYRTAGY